MRKVELCAENITLKAQVARLEERIDMRESLYQKSMRDIKIYEERDTRRLERQIAILKAILDIGSPANTKFIRHDGMVYEITDIVVNNTNNGERSLKLKAVYNPTFIVNKDTND